MQQYVCIHGHFYQPPRENPWLEAVEQQDSAYPYHDWNERITAECYAPNSVSRILDGEGRITHVVNNYARISFNIGPTLLSWLQHRAPEVYRAIIQADWESRQAFSGHGNALAQVYNHMILPLANRRDKRTQVQWGVRDFEHRFGRRPEGMWLAETAVDLETLEVLAEHDIRFTILSPYQASRVRPVPANRDAEGEVEWQDVLGGRIDPTTAYVQRLPSGRSIALFFYDSPIARAVAFERLLIQGENLAERLLDGFRGERPWPQLVHIATDGESYGHHHPHGDMALAYALQHLEAQPDVRLTNYGEFLEKHPPQFEVTILDHTAWSCSHGVDRWQRNCGCNSGRSSWHQRWRGPLRQAFDWLRDRLAPPFEERGRELLRDPWAARDDFISVLLDRSTDSVDRFLARHAAHELRAEEKIIALKLLEMQRHAQLTYTSCGWFFDELSGLETVQVIRYAGRALQLGEQLFGTPLEEQFLELLARAPSNLPEYADGRGVYEKLVRPAVLDWEKVGAHYAVSSLFEAYPQQAQIYCYTAERENGQTLEAGKARFAVGKARLTSTITRESEVVAFGVLHFGDHNVNGGVRRYQNEESYRAVVRDLSTAFSRADFPEIVRLMDRGFGESTYSLRSLFRDVQRRILRQVLRPAVADAEAAYRHLYDQHLPTMRYLANVSMPQPRVFQASAEYLCNTDLRWAFEDDEPNLEHIRSLLDEASRWGVTLDAPGLAYRLKKTIARMAERFRDYPEDSGLMRTLDGAVTLALALPFEVDLWQAQNVYAELMHSVFPAYLNQATGGDDEARAWLERFIDLGDHLNMRVADLRSQLAECKRMPTVRDLIQETFARRRLPAATYRLQFNPTFTFSHARELVPYLAELGVSDVYTSPLFAARPGSMHGYDICDHSRLNPELGGAEGFNQFSDAVRAHGLGLILDIVPNHMGINHPLNGWWMDVLENGPSSIYNPYFDIDWHPVNPRLAGKVLLPVLGDQYGRVLESGAIRLTLEDGAFYLYCYETRLPVAPRTYIILLEHRLNELVHALGEQHAHVLELRSILTALRYLPTRDQLTSDKIAERNREKEIIKQRLAALVNVGPEVRANLQLTLQAYNGRPGDPRSFDLLHGLIDLQPYRPAYWRVAAEEINFRRFFDINELAAIRTEVPEVFLATHRLVFRLLAEGKVTGLRIDHPDGLWDPTGYFRQLQENYVLYRVQESLKRKRPDAEILREVTPRLQTEAQREAGRQPAWPLYVVAEKILVDDEPLPSGWAVYGTVGYEFLNAVNGLFVDADAEDRFSQIYAQFTGRRFDFHQFMIASQRMILRESMSSELNALGHELDRISERNRRYRDFTLNTLTLAAREVIAGLFIYRTYITGPGTVSARDRKFIEDAVETARNENPRVAEAVFDFIRDTLLMRNLEDFAEEDRPLLINWVMKFQQLTGPVIAKALEDTTFYVYNRLVSLNEVGSNPRQFGLKPAVFHDVCAERRAHWPYSMLATSTHDTKRSEDVRARINVLSEMPHEWETALKRWSELNAPHKSSVEGRPAPDRNDEYLLYQILLGTWPAEPMREEAFARFRGRIGDYMRKATREAKIHTSWINPHEEYDEAVQQFVLRLLPDGGGLFLTDLMVVQRQVSFFGYLNSLAQTVLKLTCPGVPDLYQGTELWDFSLVDPDNRRPVDYGRRREMLAELRQRLATADEDLTGVAADLLARMADGAVKLYTIHRTLQHRRQHEELFRDGSYTALEASGERQEHVCAFARLLDQQALMVAVPRLVLRLVAGQPRLPLGQEVWRDTRLHLPEELRGQSWRNLFTGEALVAQEREGRPGLFLADVFRTFPICVAALCR